MRKETNMRLLKITFSTECIPDDSSYAASIPELFFQKSYDSTLYHFVMGVVLFEA
jgi:hypothetical protein